jgi:hypothetical protein
MRDEKLSVGHPNVCFDRAEAIVECVEQGSVVEVVVMRMCPR